MNWWKHLLSGVLIFCGTTILMSSCGDDETGDGANTVSLEVRLTDDPADYEAVIIDLVDVQINYDGNNWMDLDTDYVGSYNLLDYTNGEDTLIASSEMEVGTLNEVRLILGGENFVQIDGDLIPLRTPSAQQSGLKIKIENGELLPGRGYVLDLDFDAGRSVVRAGNSGNYNLKPVIRASFREVDLPDSGISGSLVPAGMNYLFAYTEGGDTVGTYANENGNFLLSPLPANVYTLEIVPTENAAYDQLKIDAISVTPANITELGVISLE